MKRTSLYLLVLLISLSSLSAFVIEPNIFNYSIFKQVGVEKDMYSVSIDKDNICLDTGGKTEITYSEDKCNIIDELKGICIEKVKDKKIAVPSYIDLLDNEENKIKSIEKVNNNFCFETQQSYTKIGNESLIIQGQGSYSSQDFNIRQEDSFTHLEVNDSSLLIFLDFDMNTTSYTFDHTNNNHDGGLVLVTTADWKNNSGIDSSGAYNFSSTKRIAINDSDDISLIDNFTIICGARREKDGSWDGICSKLDRNAGINASGWSMIFDATTDKWGMAIGSGLNNTIKQFLQDSAGSSTDFSQHYLSINVLNRNITFWLDGKLQSASTTLPIKDNDNSLVLGQYYSDDFTQPIQGFVDNVYYFNRSLSELEMNNTIFRTSTIFNSNGSQKFKNIDLGTNRTVNISFGRFRDYNNTYISISLGNDTLNTSSYNITKNSLFGNITGISLSLASANFTNKTNLTLNLQYFSDSNNRFTPMIYGNITLDGYNVTDTTVTASPNSINATTFHQYNIGLIEIGSNNNVMVYYEVGYNNTINTTDSNASYSINLLPKSSSVTAFFFNSSESTTAQNLSSSENHVNFTTFRQDGCSVYRINATIENVLNVSDIINQCVGSVCTASLNITNGLQYKLTNLSLNIDRANLTNWDLRNNIDLQYQNMTEQNTTVLQQEINSTCSNEITFTEGIEQGDNNTQSNFSQAVTEDNQTIGNYNSSITISDKGVNITGLNVGSTFQMVLTYSYSSASSGSTNQIGVGGSISTSKNITSNLSLSSIDRFFIILPTQSHRNIEEIMAKVNSCDIDSAELECEIKEDKFLIIFDVENKLYKSISTTAIIDGELLNINYKVINLDYYVPLEVTDLGGFIVSKDNDGNVQGIKIYIFIILFVIGKIIYKRWKK